MDPFGENLEEAVEDPMPLLGVDLLGELHRPGYVGEEHGDMLALALDHRSRREDAVGEMFRRVRARVAPRSLGPRWGRSNWRNPALDRRAARVAETSPGPQHILALRAAYLERGPT